MAQAGRAPRRDEGANALRRSDWAVALLAAAGVGIAAYLTWLKLTGAGAAFCAAESGCDAVQSSRYAILLGVPTALWGALFYATVGVLALYQGG